MSAATGVGEYVSRAPGEMLRYITEAADRKVRERNAERRAVWALRVCAGIDAAKRAPVTVAELRGRTR